MFHVLYVPNIKNVKNIFKKYFYHFMNRMIRSSARSNILFRLQAKACRVLPGRYREHFNAPSSFGC